MSGALISKAIYTWCDIGLTEMEKATVIRVTAVAQEVIHAHTELPFAGPTSKGTRVPTGRLLKMGWVALKDWFMGLGQQYHVNPLIFGAIYVGANPFFTASIARLVQNYRQRRSIVLPALAAGFCFISAYLYLMIVGQNVPLWVYGVVIALILFGAVSTIRKVRKQINEFS